MEEAAGELDHAALRAEDAGEMYRACDLWEAADRPAEVIRITDKDVSAQGLLARAKAFETAGDLPSAAPVFERCGEYSARRRPVRLGGAVHGVPPLSRGRPGDQAIEDPRTRECLTRLRDYETLTRVSVEGAEARGLNSACVRACRISSSKASCHRTRPRECTSPWKG